jgi:ABC-type amino acid transport substrate-binding protein
MDKRNYAVLFIILILLAIQPAFVHSKELQSDTDKNLVTQSDSDRSGRLSGKLALSLTPEEKTWLKAHPRIRIGLDPDFAPYSFLDYKGNLTGASFDFVKRIEEILGIEFELAQDLSWKDIQQHTRDRNLDVMTPALVTEQRKKYLLFTKQYLPTPQVITCRVDDNRFNSASDLIGKRVAIAVAGAFEKIKVALQWVAQQVFVAEPQGPVDVAVNSEAVLRGVNIWNAAVMPFKVQAVGCDNAVEGLQRGG